MKVVYKSPIYGTYTTLPTEIVYDIPRKVVGGNCWGRDAACDAANLNYVMKKQANKN